MVLPSVWEPNLNSSIRVKGGFLEKEQVGDQQQRLLNSTDVIRLLSFGSLPSFENMTHRDISSPPAPWDVSLKSTGKGQDFRQGVSHAPITFFGPSRVIHAEASNLSLKPAKGFSRTSSNLDTTKLRSPIILPRDTGYNRSPVPKKKAAAQAEGEEANEQELEAEQNALKRNESTCKETLHVEPQTSAPVDEKKEPITTPLKQPKDEAMKKEATVSPSPLRVVQNEIIERSNQGSSPSSIVVPTPPSKGPSDTKPNQPSNDPPPPDIQLGQLQQQVQTLHQLFQQNQKQVQVLTSESTKLSQQLQACQGCAELHQSTVQSLQQEIATCKTEHQKLEQKLLAREQTTQQSLDALQQVTAEWKIQLQETLESAMKETATLQQQLQEQKADMQSLQKELQAAAQERQQASKPHSKMASVQNEVQQTIFQLESELEIAKQDILQTKQDAANERQQARDSTSKLQSEMASLQQEMQRTMSQLKSELEKAKQDTKQSEQQLQTYQHRAEVSLRQELQEAQQQAQESIAQAQARAKEAQQQLLQEAVQTLQNERGRAVSQLQEGTQTPQKERLGRGMSQQQLQIAADELQTCLILKGERTNAQADEGKALLAEEINAHLAQFTNALQKRHRDVKAVQVEEIGVKELEQELECTQAEMQQHLRQQVFECQSLRKELTEATQQHEQAKESNSKLLEEVNTTKDNFRRVHLALNTVKTEHKEAIAKLQGVETESQQFWQRSWDDNSVALTVGHDRKADVEEKLKMVELRVKELDQQVGDTQQQLEQQGLECQALRKDLSEAAQEDGQAKESITNLQEEVGTTKEKVNEVKVKLDNVEKEHQDTIATLKGYETESRQFLKQSWEDNSVALTATHDRIADLEEKVREVEEARQTAESKYAKKVQEQERTIALIKQDHEELQEVLAWTKTEKETVKGMMAEREQVLAKTAQQLQYTQESLATVSEKKEIVLDQLTVTAEKCQTAITATEELKTFLKEDEGQIERLHMAVTKLESERRELTARLEFASAKLEAQPDPEVTAQRRDTLEVDLEELLQGMNMPESFEESFHSLGDQKRRSFKRRSSINALDELEADLKDLLDHSTDVIPASR